MRGKFGSDDNYAWKGIKGLFVYLNGLYNLDYFWRII
jgi:hypothetical protein